MRFGIIVFPGTWSERDCRYSLSVIGQEADLVWHRESDLSAYDCLVLPGGFSYGDYLRPGAIARFSPAMEAVAELAEAGKLVIGICNGFQLLCEAKMLPGALRRNESLQYRYEWVFLRVESVGTPFTCACLPGQLLRMPISHGDGSYYANEETIRSLERDNRVAFRYCDGKGEVGPKSNPNGTLANIAGVVNDAGNVLGLMPHPERACEQLLGGEDGLAIWRSVLKWAKAVG